MWVAVKVDQMVASSAGDLVAEWDASKAENLVVLRAVLRAVQ